VALLRKMTCNLRHPMSLRHPVPFARIRLFLWRGCRPLSLSVSDSLFLCPLPLAEPLSAHISTRAIHVWNSKYYICKIHHVMSTRKFQHIVNNKFDAYLHVHRSNLMHLKMDQTDLCRWADQGGAIEPMWFIYVCVTLSLYV